MKILIMGAGGVGAYYGARLQQAGEDVVFCARGENLRALGESGLEVKSPKGDFKLIVTATDRPADFAPYDLILFCVKSYDTETVGRSLAGQLAPGGTILTVQNGVENEAILADVFGPQAVMGGNARVGAELVAPGRLLHSTGGLIEFGESDGRVGDRTRALAELFKRAGIYGRLSESMRTERWKKLMWNASFNTVSALTRRRVGEILEDSEGLATVRNLMSEIVTVARAEGADLSFDFAESEIARSRAELSQVRPSTLQDLERGKRLEYDALSGAVMRAARRHGIEVPVIETVNALLKLVDDRTDASTGGSAPVSK